MLVEINNETYNILKDFDCHVSRDRLGQNIRKSRGLSRRKLGVIKGWESWGIRIT